MQAPQRAATTAFTRLRTYCDGRFSLLRATLVEGGRQHQIRRHLNSVAHQVVGDTQYGKSRINAILQAVVSIAIMSTNRAIVSRVMVVSPSLRYLPIQCLCLSAYVSSIDLSIYRTYSLTSPPQQAEHGLPRIFLHAERLRLRLDGDALGGEPALEVEVYDPLAEDLAAFLERLPP